MCSRLIIVGNKFRVSAYQCINVPDNWRAVRVVSAECNASDFFRTDETERTQKRKKRLERHQNETISNLIFVISGYGKCRPVKINLRLIYQSLRIINICAN